MQLQTEVKEASISSQELLFLIPVVAKRAKLLFIPIDTYYEYRYMYNSCPEVILIESEYNFKLENRNVSSLIIHYSS